MRKVLETPLLDLDLSVKAFNFVNALEQSTSTSTKTVRDLIKYTKKDLQKRDTATIGIINEIVEQLRCLGLELKKELTIDDDIEKFDLSSRLRYKLPLNGIHTLRQVLENKEKVFDIEQLGFKCFSELDMVFEDLDIESNLYKHYEKKVQEQKILKQRIKQNEIYVKPKEVKEQLQEDVLTILEGFGIDKALEGADYNKLVNALCDTIITNVNKLN